MEGSQVIDPLRVAYLAKQDIYILVVGQYEEVHIVLFAMLI